MLKVLPKVLDALRLGDALEVFTDGVPANKCPTEVVPLVFVIEVVPLGRFKSSDRRRVEVIWISGAATGTALDAAAADGVVVDGATGDD